MLLGCDDGDPVLSGVDAGFPGLRCGVWEPSRDDAERASDVTPLEERDLPALQADSDASREVGISVAYAPGQELNAEQVRELLDFSPFCIDPPPEGGVSCNLHFKLNGAVRSARDASPRGGCIEEVVLAGAGGRTIFDEEAAYLMGLNPARTFSLDGPLSNVLFVEDIELNNMAGNRCGPSDVACAFPEAGGVLIERSAGLNNRHILKHEVGHLHNLQHTARAKTYVSAVPASETRISEDACKHMRRHRPQNYSPWFAALGGTISIDPVECP